MQSFKCKKLLIVLILIIIAMIVFICNFLISGKKEYYISEKTLQIPIYTYHQIVENPSEVETDYMQTTYSNFVKQINGLRKLGYTPITYQDLLDYKNGIKAIKKRSCIITFDDGYTSVYDYIYPFIKENNIPITLFVVNNLVGADGYMTWEQIKEMHNSKLVAVYSHGLNHSEYDKLGPEILLAETEEAYENLKQNLDDNSLLKIFAYPCGFYTDEEIDLMKNHGYIQNLMDGKINKSNTLDLNRLHRVYPLNDSVLKILVKQIYKASKYSI